MKLFLRLTLAVALLAVMVTIFAYSSETRDQSTATSEAITSPIIKLFYPNIDAFDETAKETIILMFSVTVRTAAHYFEYFVLGALAVAILITYKIKNNLLNVLAPLGFSFLYALSDEIHQIFVQGRSCQFTDIIIDVCGALVGILTVFTVVRLTLTKNEKIIAPNN